ncbi:MAG: VWA domain-containing protein [Elusimicrobia bacterium]|nr:VWA domain-containing protein [Elusimicrobiota bacterium]
MTTGSIAFALPLAGILGLVIALAAFLVMRLIARKKWGDAATLDYPQTQAHAELLENSGRPAGQDNSEIILKISRMAALALIAIALARPQKVTIEEIEPVLGVDIMLTLDTSASMQALDFQPFNRLQAAKKIATEFIDKRKGDRVGIVIFGGTGLLSCPPTLDHHAVKEFMEQVEIGMTQTEGTAIGSGLMTALAHLKKVPSLSKVVVLLTDGRSNAGSVDPVTAAKTAQALGVKVYTIGAGKRGGSIYPVQDPIFGLRYIHRPEEEIDEDALTKIATATGGRYYRATDLGELKAIFEEIDRLEKTEIQPPRRVQFEELYPPLLLAALFFLGTEIFLRATLLFRIP